MLEIRISALISINNDKGSFKCGDYKNVKQSRYRPGVAQRVPGN
jgi:hypothetical protein